MEKQCVIGRMYLLSEGAGGRWSRAVQKTGLARMWLMGLGVTRHGAYFYFWFGILLIF